MYPFSRLSALISLISCLALIEIATSNALCQNQYSVTDQPQTVQGNYSPQQPAANQSAQETIGPQQHGASNGIPEWVLNGSNGLSDADSLKVQQLYIRAQVLKEELNNPKADLIQYAVDFFGNFAETDGMDEPPRGEERHQQDFELNEIKTNLQQIFDRNGILASPFDDNLPPQSSSQNANLSPGNGNNGNFSISTSDSTPNGFPNQRQQPPAPVNWLAGGQNWLQDSTGSTLLGTQQGPTAGNTDSPGSTTQTQQPPQTGSTGSQGQTQGTPTDSPNSGSASTGSTNPTSSQNPGERITQTGGTGMTIETIHDPVLGTEVLITNPPSPSTIPLQSPEQANPPQILDSNGQPISTNTTGGPSTTLSTPQDGSTTDSVGSANGSMQTQLTPQIQQPIPPVTQGDPTSGMSSTGQGAVGSSTVSNPVAPHSEVPTTDTTGATNAPSQTQLNLQSGPSAPTATQIQPSFQPQPSGQGSSDNNILVDYGDPADPPVNTITTNTDPGPPETGNGIEIDGQPDDYYPDPADGISIDTQAITNPSNNSLAVEAANTPIWIDSTLLSDPQAVVSSGTGGAVGSSASGGSHIDWLSFANNAMQILSVAGQIYGMAHPGTVPVYPTNTLAARQPLQVQQTTQLGPKPIKKTPGTAPTPPTTPAPTKPLPKPPSSGPQPPAPPDSGFCAAGYHENPVALACAAAPPFYTDSNGNIVYNYCDHVGGNPSAPFIPWCVHN